MRAAISRLHYRSRCGSPATQHCPRPPHRELHIGLSPPASIFVIAVVLFLPLVAMGLLWTTAKRLGLILLSISMFGSLLFGMYHHFLAMSSDDVHSQPPNALGLTFVLTAYGLSVTEAIGAFVGIYVLWIAKAPSDRVV